MQAKTQAARIAIKASTLQDYIGNPDLPVLSDSDALLTEISSQDPASFMMATFTWDIMAQGTGSNNGYDLIEKEEEYRARLERVGQKLGQFLRNNQNLVAIVNLQNVPTDPEKQKIFFNAIKKELPADTFSGFDQFFTNTSQKNDLGVLTLLNTSLVSPTDFQVVASSNGGIVKAQVLDLNLKGQNLAVRSVNGVFGTNPSQVQGALRDLGVYKNYDSQVITSGIFGTQFGNLDKERRQENYLYNNAAGWTGFHFKYNPATYEFTRLAKIKAQPAGTPPPQTQSTAAPSSSPTSSAQPGRPTPPAGQSASPQATPSSTQAKPSATQAVSPSTSHSPAPTSSAKPSGQPQPTPSPQAAPAGQPSPAPAAQPSPRPQGPAPATATSEGKINSRLDWSTFVTKFAQGDYKVEKTSTNSAKVINTKDPNEFVTVNKITQDRMSVTASNLEGKTLNKLIEVAKEVYEPGTVVSIDITQGNPPLTDPETQRIKNELWLKAVNSGLKVKNHIPDDAFLTANDKDIPEQYKKKPEPPPSSPSPSRS